MNVNKKLEFFSKAVLAEAENMKQGISYDALEHYNAMCAQFTAEAQQKANEKLSAEAEKDRKSVV